MNKNPIFRILSIDFDFFQDVTQRQLDHYPDGIDLPSYITELTWASNYASDKNLMDVRINQSLYQTIMTIINNQPSNIPVLLTNSHINAYDFIIKHSKNRPVYLINVDLHHDLINDNNTLDCGNWIGQLMKEHVINEFQWIAREISIECYGEKLQEISHLLNMTFTLDCIQTMTFDAIFICRSDTWTPPHLDTYFDNLLNLCCDHFTNCKMERQITKPREYKKYAEQIQSMMKQMKNNPFSIKNHRKDEPS